MFNSDANQFSCIASFRHGNGLRKPHILAIHVIRLNDEMSASLEEMSNTIFGLHSRTCTTNSQFNHCSCQQFALIMASGINYAGEKTSNGVAEIIMNINIVGEQERIIKHEVLTKANRNCRNLESHFSFAMVFAPPGIILG